jgi:septal ring factor EnvC (AmiA/AmiB activator)
MDERGEIYCNEVRESLVKITEQLNYIANTVESLRKDIKANDEKIRAFEIQMIKLADTTTQQQKEIEATITRLDKTKAWIAGIASAVIISILLALLKLIIPSI